MRWMLVLMTSALVTGCSTAQEAETIRTPLSVPAKSSTSPTSTTSAAATPTTTATAAGPAPGADVADAITWIEAGAQVAPEDFAGVSREGVGTAVEGGVAFSTDSVNCISTSAYRDGALACLVDLADPPPRPPDAISVWKGNWVDFDGATVDVGSVRGDPGPFGNGEGATLAAGDSLTFGDFRCRADTDAVLCVNYAQRSAVRLSAGGVDGFGCLRETEAPADIGVRLSC